MEVTCFPKRRLELEPHGTKSQKTCIIDTAVETSKKSVLGPYIVSYGEADRQ
jgi:hypothetical protein